MTASVVLAFSAWRGSRPFDVIRVNRAFGLEQTHPRWMVWLPTIVLAFAGIAVVPSTAIKPASAAFMFFWFAVVVAISAQYARALKRSRRNSHS